ncbi:MoxR family ATPase [Actinobacteria bacterium YIM 96077]|uniref:ATPase n=1 Tax=Phytoactinopolyspora halophila TaxID=1981511 RepID=A0A329QPQ3_9ACTN|nr:MoxR family ATPase [Phytoactinopolyspora halophila]AYY15669.1 MoxR family ATPase [Actinobacteria bacterium YIM 96077]RAW14146.1 ATPase [Phytoactinopolyspora halophila]
MTSETASTEPGEQATSAASVQEVATSGEAVLKEVGTVVVGMEQPLRMALAAILAGGHVLFEDVPGLGKTLAARSLAGALGLSFRRLQCTPDLLPGDVTGSYVWDPGPREFSFRAGPLFTGLLLADEINRTPPKTQSALLEAMAEKQITVEGATFQLSRPFHVLATSNPVEYEGTYPLPEAQLDRFMLRLSAGYLEPAREADVLARRIARRREETEVTSIVDARRVQALQAGVEAVDVDASIIAYCVDLASATRRHRAVEVGASPRGSQALLLTARALAVLDGRDYVVPEDVKAVAVPALAHRLTLTPEAWTMRTSTSAIVNEILDQVPGPATKR